MQAAGLDRNALYKRLKTQQSPARIALILEALSLTPGRLRRLSDGAVGGAAHDAAGRGRAQFQA